MAKDKFEALPADLQAIVETAAIRMNEWTLAAMEAANAEYLEKIRQVRRLEIRPFPDEVLDQLRAYTQEVVEELADSDPFARRVYDSYTAFRQKATAWADLSERQYYERLSKPAARMQ